MSAPLRGRLVVIFIDTDKHASPFEPLVLADVLPDAIPLLYHGVDVEDARRIIQDAMFARGPKGAKFTKIFVGGSDVERVGKIVEVIKATMFPPFEMAVLVDPRGNNTTAAAAMAKLLQLSLKHGMGDLKGKNVAILAGTGPVGFAAAVLAGLEGANVIVTSRSAERAQAVAERANKEIGVERVRGVKAASPEEMVKVIEWAELVLATGPPGVRLLPLDVLKSCGTRVRILGDVNAVPPTGIEGLEPGDEDKEVLPGVYGVGALRIGALKNVVLAELFKRLAEASRGVLDYRAAYEVAKSAVLR